eukprot:86364_1
MKSNQENLPPMSIAWNSQSIFTPHSNSNDTNNTINKWQSKRIAASIGANIWIRFGKSGISLGLRWIDKHRKAHSAYGLEFIDFLKHINDNEIFSIQQRKHFIQTYEQTMTLKYLSDHFIHWPDVQSDIMWQRTVQCYLHQLRYLTLCAIHHNALRDVQSTNIAQFKAKLNAIQLEYKQQLDEKQNAINHQNNVLTIQRDTINRLQTQMRRMTQAHKDEIAHIQQEKDKQMRDLTHLRQDKKKLQRKCKYRDTQVDKLKTNQIIAPRIPINESKRPLQLQRRRANQIFSKTEHLTSEKDRSRVFTEAVHNRYPSHHEQKNENMVQSINKEMKQIERKNAAQQFRRDIEYDMTQQQARVQRKNLFENKNSYVWRYSYYLYILQRTNHHGTANMGNVTAFSITNQNWFVSLE